MINQLHQFKFNFRHSVILALTFCALTTASVVSAKPSFVPAGEPFQASLCYNTEGISCGNISDVFNVPVGYTAVIEFLSASCEIKDTSETILTLTLGTSVSGNWVTHRFPVEPVSPDVDISNRYMQAMTTMIYADEDTPVYFSVNAYGQAPRRCFASISGRLIEKSYD